MAPPNANKNMIGTNVGTAGSPLNLNNHIRIAIIVVAKKVDINALIVGTLPYLATAKIIIAIVIIKPVSKIP
jgi:hypothetical protein